MSCGNGNGNGDEWSRCHCATVQCSVVFGTRYTFCAPFFGGMVLVWGVAALTVLAGLGC